jgi:adenine deaminase
MEHGWTPGRQRSFAGFCVHDELVAMVRGGMTPLASLQAATVNPARYFGLLPMFGSVAPGKAADLVLLEANPLTDITNVRRIRAVVAAGRSWKEKSLTSCRLKPGSRPRSHETPGILPPDSAW